MVRSDRTTARFYGSSLGPLRRSQADLPRCEIDSYELERLEYVVSPEFTRVTTLVHLRGGGEEGIGEDVTYTSTDHPPPADLPLAGIARAGLVLASSSTGSRSSPRSRR